EPLSPPPLPYTTLFRSLLARLEAPAVLEARKRPADIFDQDLASRTVERDAAGEGLLDQLERYRHVGDDHLETIGLLAALPHHQRSEEHTSELQSHFNPV